MLGLFRDPSSTQPPSDCPEDSRSEGAVQGLKPQLPEFDGKLGELSEWLMAPLVRYGIFLRNMNTPSSLALSKPLDNSGKLIPTPIWQPGRVVIYWRYRRIHTTHVTLLNIDMRHILGS